MARRKKNEVNEVVEENKEETLENVGAVESEIVPEVNEVVEDVNSEATEDVTPQDILDVTAKVETESKEKYIVVQALKNIRVKIQSSRFSRTRTYGVDEIFGVKPEILKNLDKSAFMVLGEVHSDKSVMKEKRLLIQQSRIKMKERLQKLSKDKSKK